MKKVLLLLSLLLASIAFSNAQSPPAKKGITLPAGFTYANRAEAKAGDFFGPDLPNLVVAAAMELPAADGVTIKGLHFDTRSGVEKGKIFVASRSKDSLSGKYKLEAVEAVALKSGINSFTYKTPIVTKPEKVYIIGYECTATEGDNGLVNPLVFIRDTTSWREAFLLAWENEAGLHSPIDKVGKMVPFSQFSSPHTGNVAIVAQLDDPKKNMDRMAVFFTGVELPFLEHLGSSIPASATKMKFQIHNIGLKPIKEVLLEVKKSDGSAPVTKVLKLDLKPQDFKIITYELGEITKKGAGAVTFSLKEVDGKANGCNDFNRTQRVLNYKLLDETQAVLRNELLVEHFTEEDCRACPYSSRRIDTAILNLREKGIDIKPIIVSHHCGLGGEGDFLTQKGSLELIPYFQAPVGVTFAPAMVLNRNGKKGLMALQDEQMIYMSIPYEIPTIESMIKVALSQRSEAYIDRIVQKPNADSTLTTITITGKDLSGGTVKDDLFVSVYRIENGISHRKQAGLTKEQAKTYKHDHVVREFVTKDPFGAKPEWNGNNFTLTLKDVKLDPDWSAEDMSFVIFIHRDIRSKALANRYVYSSAPFGLKQATSTREVSDALRPTAYSRDGRIFLEGSFDSFEVYDLGGRSVAKDSETVLPSGVYVVKARLGDVDYTSKTLVP